MFISACIFAALFLLGLCLVIYACLVVAKMSEPPEFSEGWVDLQEKP